MKTVTNKIIADEGHYLKTKYGDQLYSSISLGNNYIYKNGSTQLIYVNSNDVYEVYPVSIDSQTYYVQSTTYPELVSELIHQRYSLDDEMALIANSRIGNDKGEQEYQEWRTICKKAAKKLIK